MIKGNDFIIFSDDWARHPFSCQHIMRRFLPENRLLWVQTIGMRRPQLTPYDLWRSIQKIMSFMGIRRRPNEPLPFNLTTLSPFMLPFGNSLVRASNRRSVIRMVRRVLAELKFRDPILLTTLPNAADYLHAFGERAAIYYCVDDFTRWPGVNERLVIEMEQRLLSGVDLLVCSSDELAAQKRRPGLSTAILSHGVDFEHFAQAGMCAAGVEQFSKPVIGYFGLLGDWVDIELIELIARRFSGGTVLLIGSIVADKSRVFNLPNVESYGPVEYADLPRRVAQMDVLILPYRTRGRGPTITPLKLREYLATGKPVVSTALPEAIRMKPWVRIAETPTEFVSQIEEALTEPLPSSERLQDLLRRESWEAKAEKMAELISEALLKKSRVI
jgi:glycosyltransferase involved in cell wall biosynthesis